MSEELKPTSGKAWRKAREEGEVGILPSGMVARGRTVLPRHILELGEEVPDILVALALKLFYGKATYPEVVAFRAPREDAAEAIKVGKALKIVTRAFLLEPRIVDEPIADDEISIDDVTAADQAYIWDMAFMGADQLRKFFREPNEQARDLQAVETGEPVSQVAE